MPLTIRRDSDKTLRRLETELAQAVRQRDRAYQALESLGYGTYEYTQMQREYSRLCGVVTGIEQRIEHIERSEEW
jgi:hypothetical protein